MTLLRQPERERNPDCTTCRTTAPQWACRRCLRDRTEAHNPGWKAWGDLNTPCVSDLRKYVPSVLGEFRDPWAYAGFAWVRDWVQVVARSISWADPEPVRVFRGRVLRMLPREDRQRDALALHSLVGYEVTACLAIAALFEAWDAEDGVTESHVPGTLVAL